MSADATSGTRGDHSPALYASLVPEVQIAEHERQFREMLEFCPAALVIVDEDGRRMERSAEDETNPSGSRFCGRHSKEFETHLKRNAVVATSCRNMNR
jgi:hypothetical protein